MGGQRPGTCVGNGFDADFHAGALGQPVFLRVQRFRKSLAHGAKTDQSYLDVLHSASVHNGIKAD